MSTDLIVGAAIGLVVSIIANLLTGRVSRMFSSARRGGSRIARRRRVARWRLVRQLRNGTPAMATLYVGRILGMGIISVVLGATGLTALVGADPLPTFISVGGSFFFALMVAVGTSYLSRLSTLWWDFVDIERRATQRRRRTAAVPLAISPPNTALQKWPDA